MGKMLICIGRQYGSGGSEIGNSLAAELGIPCYDRRLVDDAARELGLNPDDIEHMDESANSLLYSLSMGSYVINGYTPTQQMPFHEKLFALQASIIRETAQKGSAVFIGRCADFILKDQFDCFSVFVYAPIEFRIDRIKSGSELSTRETKKLIASNDKRRAANYSFRTGETWGRSENYSLCLDSSVFGIGGSAGILKRAAELYFDR